MSATANESYAQWLERKMGEQELTLRGLARKWRPEDPENARRSLRRYLKGMVPIQRVREEIAVALGSEESEPSPEDDAEDD